MASGPALPAFVPRMLAGGEQREDSFTISDGDARSRITLDIPGTLRKDQGIIWGVENEVLSGGGVRFDPMVQIRQGGDITHAIEMTVRTGEKTTLARAFGSSNLPNVQSTPLEFWEGEVSETELAITHGWRTGRDPSVGDEAVVRASDRTRIGSMVRGPTPIIIGREANATRQTLTLTGARHVDGQTEIDWTLTSEDVRGSGFGTGLDIGVFDGTTLVDPEVKSFTVGFEGSGTVTVGQELSHPCLRITSIEQQLADDSPAVGWSCTSLEGGVGPLAVLAAGAAGGTAAGVRSRRR